MLPIFIVILIVILVIVFMYLMTNRGLTGQYLKTRRESMKDKDNFRKKQREQMLLNELTVKLDRLLIENDSVTIEVNENVIEEFINILDGPISNKYTYEQLPNYTQFVFRPKQIIL